MKHIVIVGATSLIAEHCARLWLAEGPAELTLVARSAERASAISADLQVRSPGSTIHTVATDFLDPEAIAEVVTGIDARSPIDVALIAHGSLPHQDACQNDLKAAATELHINGVSPVLFAEAFAGPMQARGAGQVALIGSVAGDRGRKSNYVYGSAKGMIERYAQGLQHRLAATDVSVSLIKPGPTRTPMTTHLDESGPALADVESVARAIVTALNKRRPVIYAPGKWWLIMMVIRHLPRFIFNRLDI